MSTATVPVPKHPPIVLAHIRRIVEHVEAVKRAVDRGDEARAFEMAQRAASIRVSSSRLAKALNELEHSLDPSFEGYDADAYCMSCGEPCESCEGMIDPPDVDFAVSQAMGESMKELARSERAALAEMAGKVPE